MAEENSGDTREIHVTFDTTVAIARLEECFERYKRCVESINVRTGKVDGYDEMPEWLKHSVRAAFYSGAMSVVGVMKSHMETRPIVNAIAQLEQFHEEYQRVHEDMRRSPSGPSPN